MSEFFNKIKIFIQKTWARLRGKNYIRTGKCNCCGACCHNIYLYIDGRKVRSEEEFKQIKQVFPEYTRFYPIGTDEKDEMLFTCKCLSEENKCLDYGNRPLICRRYPNPLMLKKGGTLIEGCGYRFIAVKDFDRMLENTVIREKYESE